MPVRIVGVDDVWANKANPPDIPDTGAFLLYLVHEPVCRPEWHADFVLAGHTHGGQLNSAAIQAINALGLVDIGGLYNKSNVPVYVTSGIGTSDSDKEYRFFALPEIVVINPHSPVAGPADIVIS